MSSHSRAHSVNGDGNTISRATSVSRRSAMSKNQTLIRKSTAVHELRPSDILIERFTAYKHIVKQLVAYFEGVADIESNTAKEMTKLGAVIQVPFKAGNQFMGEGGLQDVYYTIRDKTRTIADHHANLAKTVEGSIVQHLRKLHYEIKAHIKNVQNDTGKLATSVAREREMSTKHISDLSRAISMFKNTPMQVTSRDDPYVMNQLVIRQLQKQVHEENALQKSIIIMQQNSAHFEEGVVRSIQSAWQTFEEWNSRMSASVQETWRVMGNSMAALAPDREWISFAAKSDHLLDPETPLRNPDTVEYPSKDDPSVVPVHVGILERKKRFTRAYREAYFVLTPAGYLHEFVSSDPHVRQTPQFSLFLPACTLGPPSSAKTARSHKFHIESKTEKDGPKPTGLASRAGSLLGRNQHAYTFRSRSHEEMMEWWNDIRMLAARYLVASEQLERTGPVAAAVRSAGYLSEEEDSGEEEGSSVEEEDEDDEEDYHNARDGEDEAVPAYSQPTRESGIEMGPNGYALEKKSRGYTGGDGMGAGEPSTSDGDLARRMSRRQEKAPERGENPSVPSSPAPAPASIPPPTSPAMRATSPAAVRAPSPIVPTSPAHVDADMPSHAPVSDNGHAGDATSSAPPETNGTTNGVAPDPEPAHGEHSGGIMSKFKEMLK
ncbi:Cytoskeletal signaling protein slm1 OS=Schizosaccharomyces pombe (strain 972 / ATCC 24843) GN=slm1 PE=1 SV=1 [Rhizoctonia solani AG-1 IB]|uniref:Cytoskeletal signaling protein slm1 n=1 Tax=Thanatephorus cucumeris (strain AG1-IB / isolate 7/3/14) TaxID=1108050 RepID=A0A0B7FCK6_THACB|nr:Cytoskeletal signaling protein slm1 OS=Schizosaccharomyces pombe (strain 972 / ATCC 24843) GN=slm1 PE=1 SV=1 [Rhizoctonia solani AG-1 IB]